MYAAQNAAACSIFFSLSHSVLFVFIGQKSSSPQKKKTKNNAVCYLASGHQD
jgi:hypothetical protein